MIKETILLILILFNLTGCTNKTNEFSDENIQEKIIAQQQVAQQQTYKQTYPTYEQGNSELKKTYLLSSDVEEKRELLLKIAKYQDTETIEFLLKALHDPNPEIRRDAAILLKNSNNHPQVVNALIDALNDSNDDVILEAVESLAGVQNQRVITNFKRISEQHPDKLIRIVAKDYYEDLINIKTPDKN